MKCGKAIDALPGVAKALGILMKKIHVTMTLLGGTTISELGRECLAVDAA